MQPEVNFPAYFLTNTMAKLGWPRKEGLVRRKEVVSLRTVGLTFRQLNHVGVVLGAGAPATASALFTHGFSNRDWASSPVDDFLTGFDPHQMVLDQVGETPWVTLNAFEYDSDSHGNSDESIPWEWLSEPETYIRYIGGYVQSMLWGLLHPEEARAIVGKDAARLDEFSTEYQHYGLILEGDGVPESYESWLNLANDLVAAYVNSYGDLPPIEPIFRDHPIIAARLRSG